MDRLLLGTIWSQPFEPVWKIFALFIIVVIIDYFFNKSLILLWIAFQLQKLKKFFIVLIPILFFIATILVIYYTYNISQPINFEQILLSPKTSLSLNWNGNTTMPKAFIVSFYPLIFGISPIVFLGLFFTFFFLLKEKNKTNLIQKNATWHLLLFIIIFYTGSIFSTTIPTVRYQIILYPLIFITSAYGWHYLYSSICKNKKSFYFIIIVILICGIYSLFTIKPFYFSYNSPLLPKNHLISPKDMGDGNYEMAQYLNSLPNAKNLNIWSDKRGVCTFFVGKCVNVIRKADFIKNGPHYDYFVISKGREKRTVDLSRGYSQMRPDYPVRLDLLYTANPQPVYELHPCNRDANYIRVIPKQNTKIWRGK
jgi:hypothetical protein